MFAFILCSFHGSSVPYCLGSVAGIICFFCCWFLVNSLFLLVSCFRVFVFSFLGSIPCSIIFLFSFASHESAFLLIRGFLTKPFWFCFWPTQDLVCPVRRFQRTVKRTPLRAKSMRGSGLVCLFHWVFHPWMAANLRAHVLENTCSDLHTSGAMATNRNSAMGGFVCFVSSTCSHSLLLCHLFVFFPVRVLVTFSAHVSQITTSHWFLHIASIASIAKYFETTTFMTWQKHVTEFGKHGGFWFLFVCPASCPFALCVSIWCFLVLLRHWPVRSSGPHVFRGRR